MDLWNLCFCVSRRFQRYAAYRQPFLFVSHIRVNLGRFHILVRQHLLHHVYARSCFDLQRTEGVAGPVESDRQCKQKQRGEDET